MSVEATIWAWTANVSKSSERLVLLSLADRADEQNKCYPSMERVAKDTLLDIKTVKKVIADLIEKGFILDTGERKGLTQKVRVLQLVCVKNRENQQENEQKNEPKNGTVKQTQKRNDSKNGMNPILPTNEPKIGSLNEPKIGSQNLPLESNNESIQTNTREAGKKSSRFFDDELRPNIHALNSKLGANLITEKFIEENLFSFNAHYETQQLTDNQRLAKWIAWFKNEQAKIQTKQNITYQPKNNRPEEPRMNIPDFVPEPTKPKVKRSTTALTDIFGG